MNFNLVSTYSPTGDQPEAIEQIVHSVINEKNKGTTLLGVTGSGKTFTIANAIAKIEKPTLVISHNKTLAAQLYAEFKAFFPENAVEYFVSYYDYYQPEAYIPSTDTYIEKDLSINNDIEQMRLKTVATLLSGRKDVVVVSSVSCIYGCGNPEDFHATAITLKVGEQHQRNVLLRRLVDALYTRTEIELKPATFRVRGDSIEIMASFGEFGDQGFKIVFFDNEIEAIYSFDTKTGKKQNSLDEVTIYPCNLFVSTRDHINRAISQIQDDLVKQIEYFEKIERPLEAQRIKQRVEYDLEMIKELGYCSGIENYSRYLDGRLPGSRPFCLIDFFPKDMLVVIDESHVTVPQVRGMYGGDRSRKENLVEYGFRLPAALDNRPLKFNEFEELTPTKIYVSATPAEYEIEKSQGVIVEQLIRPTHIVDPSIIIHPTKNQIDDIIDRLNSIIKRNERAIITTISKRSAEELSRYLDRVGIKNNYIHSDIDTLDRIKILDDLREGRIDVIVGVNLLREGIDLPEVSLVMILDADKEGFLRNVRSLTQVIGRAARHISGVAVLYADTMTKSMIEVVRQSVQRRAKQIEYNYQNNCIPKRTQKSSSDYSSILADIDTLDNTTNTSNRSNSSSNVSYYNLDRGESNSSMIAAERTIEYTAEGSADDTILTENIGALIEEMREKMNAAAKTLDFQNAAKYRDKMYELQKLRDQLSK
jgi:excinuclease ABC subunit B